MSYKLTYAETCKLDAHIEKMEKEILDQYRIFVCTIGVLADSRLERWASNNCLHTVIIDEAGQLTQPGAFVVMGVKQKRSIFIGDHKQLRPTVLSYAAQAAGLWTSVLGWYEQR